MSGFLVDTSVLSLTAPDRPGAPREVEEWLLSHGPRLHLSVMSLVEIEQGVSKLERQGSTKRVERLSTWLEVTTRKYRRRILGVDEALAGAIGRLSDHAFAVGRHPGWADIIIGATAQVHSLTLLTRNTRHFQPLGIDAVDPLERLP